VKGGGERRAVVVVGDGIVVIPVGLFGLEIKLVVIESIHWRKGSFKMKENFNVWIGLRVSEQSGWFCFRETLFKGAVRTNASRCFPRRIACILYTSSLAHYPLSDVQYARKDMLQAKTLSVLFLMEREACP